ncbi:phosphate ABC transporter substrate-binding protein PstS [Micrococcus porci]|uniref:phosphate ABC transporter substrate-binding protein PstS n=1 Tax=Micrococcus TaxID=1269 RepID=UPI002578022A|nr:phosphate ABC transporter substrate-binding protein PstS [Micrococcus porci]
MKALRFGRSAALLSVAALALTACGGGNDSASSSSSAASSSAAGSSSASSSAAGSSSASSSAAESSSASGSSSAAQGGYAIDVPTASGTLMGSGASSQEAAMTAWTEGVKATSPELQVQYSPDGSGAGRKAFLSGAATFAGSDAALKDEEKTQAQEVCGPDGAFHVPAYVSPIAVAYNLEGVDSLNLDADTIAKIFSKKITKWNAPEIAALNEGVELPDTAITVVHRADESGTTENFTAYLDQVAPEAWTYGKVKEWPGDITAESAQGTKGVVSQAAATNGAITYADESGVGSLKTAKVGKDGKFAEISPEAAAKIVADGKKQDDGSIELDRANAGEGVYPIVLVSYHIFCNQYGDQETVDQVKAFASYVISEDGQKAAQEASKSAPLDAELAKEAKTRIDAIKVG